MRRIYENIIRIELDVSTTLRCESVVLSCPHEFLNLLGPTVIVRPWLEIGTATNTMTVISVQVIGYSR